MKKRVRKHSVRSLQKEIVALVFSVLHPQWTCPDRSQQNYTKQNVYDVQHNTDAEVYDSVIIPSMKEVSVR